MRFQINYVVVPTAELQALNARYGYVHHKAETGEIWQSSEHHLVRDHDRPHIEEAIWTSFLGDFDLDHLDSIGEDRRPFLRECLKLGFHGCFVIHEVTPPQGAEVLMHQAAEAKERAAENIVLLTTPERE